MPSNDDLFAGFQVGNKVVPPIVAAPQVGIKDKDLFAGMQVGGQRIPDIEFEKQRRATIEAIPEVGTGGLLSGEDQAKVAAISPVLLSTTDAREMANIITSSFPNVGITETPEGEILATNNKTGARVVVNKPGLSQLDILQGIGIVAAFSPAGAAATVPARIGAAGLTEAAIQAGQAATGGEFDPEEVALATGLGAVGELLPKGLEAGAQVFKQARQAKQVGAARKELSEVAPAITQAEEAAAETGIGLFEAQKTVVPSRLEEQSFVASLPEGARTARAALLKQNKEAAKAVDDVLEFIAPPTALETGPERFRAAAQKAAESAGAIRKERTSPLFKDALRSAEEIDVSALKDSIKTTLDDFPEDGEVAKSLGRVFKFISRKEGQPTIRQLHNAKLELDQMVTKVGENSLGNTTKKELLDVKSQLLGLMDEASPGYKVAREEFAKLSPAVEAFQQSILGKVASFKDEQLKTISKRIFDPAETNPAIVTQARKTISKVDPQAWREIMRTELERRLGAVRGDVSEAAQGVSASTENLPAQLVRAIYGNEKQRQVLFQGSPPDIAQNLKYLETALGRAKLGRPGGSQTALREEIKKQLRPGVGQSIRSFLQAPIATVTGIGEEAAFNRKVKVLSETLFSTEWKPRMAEIRKMSPGSKAAARAMAQLLNDVEKTQESQNE